MKLPIRKACNGWFFLPKSDHSSSEGFPSSARLYTGDLDYSVNDGEKDSETGIGKIKRLPKQGIFHCQILLE